MQSNLFQPIYETLQLFFPTTFFSNPFFAFLIDILYFVFGTCFLYILLVLPVKFLIKAFKGRYI